MADAAPVIGAAVLPVLCVPGVGQSDWRERFALFGELRLPDGKNRPHAVSPFVPGPAARVCFCFLAVFYRIAPRRISISFSFYSNIFLFFEHLKINFCFYAVLC
jgi:hypothetical protein